MMSFSLHEHQLEVMISRAQFDVSTPSNLGLVHKGKKNL